MLVVTIIKKKSALIPNGSTRIEIGDIMVIAAPGSNDEVNVEVIEQKITKQHSWNQKKIQSIKTDTNTLIAIIKREEKTIVPNGNTKIQENDILVIVSKM